ncbi:hypothetical protein RUND412_000464 [Rhizina undulata]
MQSTKGSQRAQSVAESVAGRILDDDDTASQTQKKAKTSRGKKNTTTNTKKGGRKKAEADKELTLESDAIYEADPPPRGIKRDSTAMDGPVVIWDGGKDTDDESKSKPPPGKKRKAPAKRGGLRASSRTRESLQSVKRVSQTVITDDELDRALELDLLRPLSDEEQDLKSYAKPFIRSTKKDTSATFPPISTPEQSAKSGGLVTSKPWTPMDLDEVFMHEPEDHENEQEEGVLTEQEKEMTVAGWIKHNAEQVEKKLTGGTERIVAILESED